MAGLVEGFRNRLPGADVTPEQLRSRSWWTGPEVFVLVDDYDLVATTSNNPLLPLVDFLSQARDVGLHFYAARRGGGRGRALLDPVLGRTRELGFPGVVMSAPRDEGYLMGSGPARCLPVAAPSSTAGTAPYRSSCRGSTRRTSEPYVGLRTATSGGARCGSFAVR